MLTRLVYSKYLSSGFPLIQHSLLDWVSYMGFLGFTGFHQLEMGFTTCVYHVGGRFRSEFREPGPVGSSSDCRSVDCLTRITFHSLDRSKNGHAIASLFQVVPGPATTRSASADTCRVSERAPKWTTAIHRVPLSQITTKNSVQTDTDDQPWRSHFWSCETCNRSR